LVAGRIIAGMHSATGIAAARAAEPTWMPRSKAAPSNCSSTGPTACTTARGHGAKARTSWASPRGQLQLVSGMSALASAARACRGGTPSGAAPARPRNARPGGRGRSEGRTGRAGARHGGHHSRPLVPRRPIHPTGRFTAPPRAVRAW
jgi:hypothetical protein